MATPICIADSWSKPLTAVQIAELQPEWDEDDKSNELLPPDAHPTQALPDRTQYYVSKHALTAGNAVCYRSIRAQRQAACEHEQYKRVIKNRDKLCAKRQLKLDIYVEKFMEYKVATHSQDSKCAHQRCTIKKHKLFFKRQLKLD